MKAFRFHVAAFAFFIPFVTMLTIHQILGLSDAMGAAPAPGERHSLLYNMLMVLTFYFGVGGYIFHVACVAERSIGWVIGKLVLLAALWAGMIWALS